MTSMCPPVAAQCMAFLPLYIERPYRCRTQYLHTFNPFVVETYGVYECEIWKMPEKVNNTLVELLESTKRISKYSTE